MSTGPDLATRTDRVLSFGVPLANLIGATVVFVFLAYLLVTPDDVVGGADLRSVNGAAFTGFMAVALVLGRVVGRRLLGPLVDWLRSEEPGGPDARRAALRAPLLLARTSGTIWAVAVVLFSALNVGFSAGLAGQVALTAALGGVTTVALTYLLAERVLRPVVTRAHADCGDAPPVLLSVTRRMLLAWTVGSGVPLVGIGLGFITLVGDEPLSPAGVLFLVAVGLLVGVLSTAAAARAVADPVRSVAAALREVGEGRLEVAVPVYDASEVGGLQTGFNAMAEGLRERARLQDLFGRQVGVDVARLALEQGVELGGERREVAVLFVDVVGSTALAVEHAPEEVVRRLNAFFGVVVDAVASHGGWVNKFEGDAALCVFGAPAALEDAAACALAAARALAAGLADLELTAAVGVGGGPVVAGHVGSESRFEYTVVGDPVNTAARLAELAKARPGRVLADAALVEAAGEEAARWRVEGEAVLRGRSAPTRLAHPA